MIKCLRARRGNVHRKQNCFRGVLLFETHFAEFCVKSVCKTEPWNWAVTPQFHGIVLHTDLLTFLLTYFSKIMSFKNISPHGEIVLI